MWKTKQNIRWGLALFFLCGLAITLRVVSINSQSFWYDEASSASLIQHSFEDLYFGNQKDHGHPPLYLLLLKCWSMAFGSSEVALRSLSILFSFLAIPLLASLGRAIVSPFVGVVAALLFAISSLQIELSTEARPYALLHFLVIANAWLLLRWVKGHSNLSLLFYSLTLYFCLFTHYFSFLLPPLHFILLFFILRDSSVRRRNWILAFLFAGLLWLPWAPAFVAQLTTPGALRGMDKSWYFQFLGTPVAFALGRTLAWRDAADWMLALAESFSILIFFYPAFEGLKAFKRDRFSQFFLGGWALAPILVPLAMVLLAKPIYSHRYGTIGLPAWFLLVAVGLGVLPKKMRASLFAALVVSAGAAFYMYYTTPIRDDWRSASKYILETSKAEELLVFDSESDIVAFNFYSEKAGASPHEIIGVLYSSLDHGIMEGVKFEKGVRGAVTSRMGEVLAAPAFVLALCMPSHTGPEYGKFFQDRGYKLTSQQNFYRVSVLHFERE